MLGTSNAAERAKWDVRWVKNGEIKVVNCGSDFVEAVRVRDLAIEGGRKNVTLRCKNFGFPPPVKLQPSVVEVVVPLATPQIVRIHGKRYRRTHEKKPMLKVPMKSLNAKGIWWCPYCMQLRRFKKTNHFVIDGIRVPETRHVCPMCEVSHRDPNVRKWNPVAVRLFYELEEAPRRRAPRTLETRRKARRRRKRLER